MLAGLMVRLRALLRRGQMDRELDEELRYHIDRQTERNVAAGMDPREARRVALRDFGGVEQMKEEVRDARGVRVLEDALQDVRFGARMLRKTPVFTLVTVALLALGIGANTTIFTLFDSVVMRKLPVADPDALVLFTDNPSEGTTRGDPPTGEWNRFSYPIYEHMRGRDEAFAQLCAFRSGETRLAVRPERAAPGAAAERAQGHLVSGNYFDLLGVRAALGRALTPADDSASAPPAVAVSHRYWTEKLGAEPSAVGRVVLLNGTSFTIVGVMPEEFFGVRVRKSPDFWIPLAFQPQVELQESSIDKQDVFWLNLMGRLAPGVTLERAQTGVDVALRQFLTAQAGSEPAEETLEAIRGSHIRLVSGARGVSTLRTRYTEALAILMAVVGLTLLIACANVGNLLLSRALARRREMVIRLALGARRGRLIRQLLTESLLLAALGGALGVLLAEWGAGLFVGLVASDAPLDVSPDAKVLGFTAAVSLVAGLLFGLAPALRSTRAEMWSGLKESSNRTVEGRQRYGLASALVVTQIALSLVLLVGAGMFARSLLNLRAEEFGFRGERLLLVDVDPRIAGYKHEELAGLYERTRERLGAVPGVESVTVASHSPMSGSASTRNLTAEGHAPLEGDSSLTHLILVGPRYCETLGIPLIAGREIEPRDVVGAAPVAVVNQAFVDHYFFGENPIGRRISYGSEFNEDWVYEIVGVVGNAKYGSVKEKASRLVYHSILQEEGRSAFSCNLELRTAGDPMAAVSSVRAALAEVAPNLPVGRVTSFEQQLEETLRQERLMAYLVAAFGVLALVLACVGLYGVMTQGVVRRLNEIGVRMALGADRGDILRLILGEAIAQVVVGMGVGLLVAAVAAQLIASMLYGVGALDLVAIAGAMLLMLTTALVSAYVPARRATKVDPVIALRYE